MTNPITFYDLEKTTGRVNCGNKGTCFLITPELALTAAHVVKKNKKEGTIIRIKFLNISDAPVERTASLLDYDLEQFDIAILKLDSPIQLDQYVSLASIDIANGENYLMYGYPNEDYTSGKKIEGFVSRTSPFHTKWDIDLNQKLKFDARGLSGAALFVNGYAVGVALTQSDGNIRTIGVKKFKTLIEKHQIPFKDSKLEDDIPDNLKEEAEETLDSSNTPVVNELDNRLQEINGGYALLTGTPGSGKTTLVANYSPELKELEIVGKYFVKIPNDSQAIAIRASKERLLSWLESVCYKVLYNKPPEKGQSDFNKKVEDVNQILIRLGEYYERKGKVGVLIIDGLDETNKIIKDNLSDFLSILPTKVPDNLCVLFSCTSKAILPSTFKSQISIDREIRVTPLEKEKVERFIKSLLEKVSLELTVTQITQLGNKSEGHPLYLRYLVNYLIAHSQEIIEGIDDFKKWIDSIPMIDGNIVIYYSSIWDKIKDKSEETKILGTISRLRQKAPKAEVIKMLPEGSREIWDSTYAKVNHLINESETNELIDIYHSSFGEFINEATKTSSNIIHNRVAQYCLDSQNTFYGISNVIYHLYNGNDTNKVNAIICCNQEWVNKCALNSVSPDYILTDIREVLRLSFSFKKSVDVIRVLLLLQRMRFRYDEIFRENAFELAGLLLAMGKPEEAIRYVIRNEILQISESDAIFILQRFYEADGDNEAEELITVLDSIYKKKLSEEYEEGYMSFSNLMMKFNAVAISSNSNPKDAYSEFSYLLMRMKDLQNKNESDPQNKEAILGLRAIVSAFYTSYIHWSYKHYTPVQELLKMNMPVDRTTILVLAIHIPMYRQFQQNSLSIDNETSLKEVADDLEFVIANYGINDKDILKAIEALIPYSTNSKLVESLINEAIKMPFDTFSIRQDNGVNANFQAIIQQINYYQILGYLGDKKQKPIILNRVDRRNWEEHIVSTIQIIGYFLGQGFRLKADSNLRELKNLVEEMKNFLHSIKFPLFNRVSWRKERAYAIPEEVYPTVYNQIVQFIVEFCPEFVADFVQLTIANPEEQLGLYTEGYRNCLFSIADELALNTDFRKSTFILLERLEEHIYKGVQNRWERAPELMKLAELYARINAEEKTEEVFKMMLDSSMGISWYKEAQLDLITSAVKSLYEDNNEPLNLDIFAGHLDFASGEMTFQRYVRMAKENFVYSLCKIGYLGKAIRYFKQITYSSPKGVKERAESSIIDTPFKGEGYELGTREIEEENVILKLLEALGDEINIYFKWILGELFVSDDIHYIQDSAKLFGEVLSTLSTSDTSQISFLLDRLVEVIKTKIDEHFQKEFISHVRQNLPIELSENLQNLLINEMVIEKESDDKSETKITKEFLPVESILKKEDVLDTYVLKAKNELEFGNKKKARAILAEGWFEKSKEKFSIFDTNSDSSFNLLVEASNTGEEILEACEDVILNDPYKEEWVLASKLIGFLGRKVDSAEKNKILETVLNHLDLMLRTTEQNKEIFKHYEWLATPSEKEDVNIQIAKFIIWLLNYPNFNSQDAIIELILWFCSMEPNLLIPLLVEEAFTEEAIISSELSMYILFKLSSNIEGKIVWENLKAKEEEILKEEHFMKKYTLLNLLETISLEIEEAEILLRGLQATFPQTSLGGVDVEPEWNWLEPIRVPFSLLQRNGFINGKICREMEIKVNAICKKHEIKAIELSRIHQYYQRSFYNQKNFISPIEYIPRYALNKTISMTIPLSSAKVVAEYLCLIPNHFN